jgi:hypothetical protein
VAPQGTAERLTRALDVVLSYLSAGAGADAARASGERAVVVVAAAAVVGDEAEAAAPWRHASAPALPPPALPAPLTPPRRARASRRAEAGEAGRVWRGGGTCGSASESKTHTHLHAAAAASAAAAAPCAFAFSAADVALATRFRAHPAAVAALRPGAAAAVLRALGAGDDENTATAASALCALAPPHAAMPLCGIMLEPLLDARGRLLPGTAALVQADSRVRTRVAHCVFFCLLRRWLVISSLTWHLCPCAGRAARARVPVRSAGALAGARQWRGWRRRHGRRDASRHARARGAGPRRLLAALKLKLYRVGRRRCTAHGAAAHTPAFFRSPSASRLFGGDDTRRRRCCPEMLSSTTRLRTHCARDSCVWCVCVACLCAVYISDSFTHQRLASRLRAPSDAARLCACVSSALRGLRAAHSACLRPSVLRERHASGARMVASSAATWRWVVCVMNMAGCQLPDS